jgi:hypothetical protein
VEIKRMNREEGGGGKESDRFERETSPSLVLGPGGLNRGEREMDDVDYFGKVPGYK